MRCTGDVSYQPTHLGKQRYPAKTQLTQMWTESLTIEFWFYQHFEIKAVYLLSGNHANEKPAALITVPSHWSDREGFNDSGSKALTGSSKNGLKKQPLKSGLLDHTTVGYISSVYTVKELEKKTNLILNVIPSPVSTQCVSSALKVTFTERWLRLLKN